MRLHLDPNKLSGFGLTPADIRFALTRENIDLPTGTIEGYYTDLSIRTLGRMETEEEFNNLIIREVNGVPVKLKDVGRAELGPENIRTIFRGNHGTPQIGIAITHAGGKLHCHCRRGVQTVERLKENSPTTLGWV